MSFDKGSNFFYHSFISRLQAGYNLTHMYHFIHNVVTSSIYRCTCTVQTCVDTSNGQQRLVNRHHHTYSPETNINEAVAGCGGIACVVINYCSPITEAPGSGCFWSSALQSVRQRQTIIFKVLLVLDPTLI